MHACKSYRNVKTLARNWRVFNVVDVSGAMCMYRLDDNMMVKVADFGLSRDIYERDYYSSDDRKAKLPVKWMALESLEKGVYNIKTDVVCIHKGLHGEPGQCRIF